MFWNKLNFWRKVYISHIFKNAMAGLKVLRLIIVALLVMYLMGAFSLMNFNPVNAFMFWFKVFGLA